MAFAVIPGRVFFCKAMRTIVFIDGQNLYHLAKKLWATVGYSAYTYPNYDVDKVAQSLVFGIPGRTLTQIRFYTGVPNSRVDPFWHDFWTNKLRYLRGRGVVVYAGRVNQSGQEKGVDVSLAIDLVQLTHDQQYDTAIIVSQDWDFGPAVKLARQIGTSQGRALSFESCFPYELGGPVNNRGIPATTWIHIDKSTYDSWFDSRDYRPRN